MVDSTRGIGPGPGIIQTGKTQNIGNVKKGDKANEARAGNANVLTEAQAEKAALEARDGLARSQGVTLGYSPSLLDETV